MGRCRSLGSLKSLLWFASQLSGAFSSWVPPGSPAQTSLVYWRGSKYSASQVPRAKVEAVLKWNIKPRGRWSIRGKDHGTIISQPEQGGVGNEPVPPRPQLNSRGIHDFNNNNWNCESFQQTMVTAEQSGWSWGSEARPSRCPSRLKQVGVTSATLRRSLSLCTSCSLFTKWNNGRASW